MLNPFLIFQLQNNNTVMSKNIVLDFLVEEFDFMKYEEGYDVDLVLLSNPYENLWPENHPYFFDIIYSAASKHRTFSEMHMSLNLVEYTDNQLLKILRATGAIIAHIKNDVSIRNFKRLEELGGSKQLYNINEVESNINFSSIKSSTSDILKKVNCEIDRPIIWINPNRKVYLNCLNCEDHIKEYTIYNNEFYQGFFSSIKDTLINDYNSREKECKICGLSIPVVEPKIYIGNDSSWGLKKDTGRV